MAAKDVITILVTAVVEAVITNLFSTIIPMEYMKWAIVILGNLIVLLFAYVYFSKIRERDKETWEILNSMNVHSQNDLIKLEKLHKNLDLIGIERCTGKLTETEFEPIKCLMSVRKELQFMGVAGSKWVRGPEVYNEFERMLTRISAAGGKVRFLLLNPKGKGWQKLKKLRKDKLSAESYAKFMKLCSEYPCLEVRLYDPMPSFRLQFVDDTFVAVSRYKFEFTEYEKTHYGWDAPHLIVNNEIHEPEQELNRHFWSLYMAFQLLYDHIWEHSSDLYAVLQGSKGEDDKNA